jgi:hypothetical protein
MRQTMSALAAVLALAVLSPAAHAQTANAEQPGGCAPGDRVDRSTAADARKKIEAAGYQRVSGLKKGCDNAWHGVAVKDGEPVHVVLNPEGKVLPEGD